MKFIQVWKRRREKKYRILYKSGPSTLALMFAGMAIALWSIFTVLTSYPVGLYLYYTVVPKTTELLGQALTDTSQQMVKQLQAAEPQPPVPQVEPVVEITRDKTLPEGRYLSIPKIKVDTVIWEGEEDNYEKALRKGVWRVDDFAEPEGLSPSTSSGQNNGQLPIILAAHRFGYVDWTQDYRIKNSFYNLPKLVNGDMIEIVWNQRRYTYQVQKVEEGTEISDYSSDLIMYTCKFLVSPVRVFVHATLTE